MTPDTQKPRPGQDAFNNAIRPPQWRAARAGLIEGESVIGPCFPRCRGHSCERVSGVATTLDGPWNINFRPVTVEDDETTGLQDYCITSDFPCFDIAASWGSVPVKDAMFGGHAPSVGPACWVL